MSEMMNESGVWQGGRQQAVSIQKGDGSRHKFELSFS
jgi:hypothetical protein